MGKLGAVSQTTAIPSLPYFHSPSSIQPLSITILLVFRGSVAGIIRPRSKLVHIINSICHNPLLDTLLSSCQDIADRMPSQNPGVFLIKTAQASRQDILSMFKVQAYLLCTKRATLCMHSKSFLPVEVNSSAPPRTPAESAFG